ncbi:hypothetical protein N7448_006589 [Penicillium atrosanguineum]|uniref:CFEM domain-containing protein n=1 Tax=Penicillium atrosanguineum TaxID=1132637 RepID=A0A9W9GZW7_9EURO|nr:uncharacterized protein N7443_010352 [Penicillium atrosanguineum]KAJ5132431.1 hypothetical protein N7448_006589 [Penicillium atrosanguineum]KAJ5137355.1 hypothetical protein N7526_003588 [Penicillium atrosanguineum]KAJ5290099.1 hypothetical protein N7443_010352 [Penicillium atrosanguineum]KAJ5307923.1 hypothetical protein N7476_008579 [Penicillium atrosanguineum]
MLFHPPYRILAAVLPWVAICSASTSSDSSSSLWDVIPDCAKTCVENFANAEYTSAECSTISDMKCLCRTETSSGLTIGEAALSCVYALCSKTIIKGSSAADAYRICDSVSDAVSETHKTITATTFPSVLSTSTTESTTADSAPATTTSFDPTPATTTQSITSTTSGDSAITAYHPTSTGTGAAPAFVSTETSSESTSSSSPSSSPAVSNENKDHHVNAGTVIGVSVVSGVAGSFIIGVAVFFLCKRWRRNNRVEDPDSDFEIGGAMAEPPGFSRDSSPEPGPRLSPGSGSTSFAALVNRPEMSQSSRTLQPGSQRPPRLVTPEIDEPLQELRGQGRIGLAASSDSEWGGSPRTLSSQATLSEPLQNQGTGLYPKPLRWTHRPISGETLFEEDEYQQGIMGRTQNAASRTGSPNVRTGLPLPANPRAFKDGFPSQPFLRAPGQQRPGQSRTLTPVSTTRGLTPPFTGPAFRRSDVSNGTSTQMDSSGGLSQETSSNASFTSPSTTAQGRILSDAHNQPNTKHVFSNTLGPPAEIVSRPRIVRGDDIKRVQIRSSPRPPSDAGAPWGPDDLWLERGRGRDMPVSPSEVPYPSEINPGAVGYPSSPKKRPEDMPKRGSPTSRNLTPSRRGQDLILRVD